jgi:chitin disaccharide deacetylase
MEPERTLIVNADDFGLTSGVTRGVIEAHERGIVTSASLMVRRAAAEEAAAYARAHPHLAVGLHLDLGESTYDEGTWRLIGRVVALDDENAIAAEVAAQLRTFKALVGRGPTHIDSHQHMHHTHPVARPAVRRALHDCSLPLRHYSTARYCGEFHGRTGTNEPLPQGITSDRLIQILEALPEGITELACHPGYADGLDSPYREERERELRVLTDPRVKAAVDSAGIALRSFSSLAVVD